MCWMCDRDAKSSLVHNFLNDADSFTRLHFATPQDKSLDAMMLTGHDLVPPQLPTVIITADAQPGDTSTTATLIVGGPHTISSLETIGDQDYFAVQLEAGQAYEIGQYAYVGGPNAVPLPDCYVEIYDSAGNLIVSGDGGASTLFNNLNSGFDVLLSFTPETNGTYYINARAYDQDPVNGTNGDFVGDYEVFVQEATGNAYQPYYDPDSPLYAIDWGTQVDGTSRNPDGAEGPRPTGNAFTGAAWNPYGIEGKNVITYYFARQGEIFIDEDPTTPGTTDTIVASGFEDWEKEVYLNAFGAYSKVADLVYVEVQDRTDADFVLITYEGTPGPGVSLLGRMSPPDEENEGRTEFNANDERWTEEGLAPGGFSFNTLIHELGHGHGLAHPHDNGGRSGIMHGVEPDGVAFSYTNGDFDLNQGVYTMMSYEDGWEMSPYGSAETTDPYGWLGSLMAFDVAAIQDKYGVNEAWATGKDTYILKDVNAAGTYYECLWDAGGIDLIAYSGARDANIDLRAASLEYEYGGGGWISYAHGVFGGFTIANGVTIENATSGWGNDTLIGNSAANVLTSGAGNDMLDGGGGGDRMIGGTGNDTYNVDSTGDRVIELVQGGTDTVLASVSHTLSDHVERLIYEGAGPATLRGNIRNNLIDASAATGVVNISGGDGVDQLKGGSAGDTLFGGRNADTLFGNGGNDRIYGGPGGDKMLGGAGADSFIYDASSVDGSQDRISGFSHAEGDKIGLGSIDANTNVAGNQAFTFIGNSAFSGTAGELHLIIDATGRFLAEGDVNGDAIADFAIQFQSPSGPITQADFVF